MQYQKIHSVSKQITTKGPKLDKILLETMREIANIVGATLGPGGQPVIIDRFESGMLPTPSKDGVTVFKALGFDNPTAHCIMEAARDAALRTASEAGDGTTSCTILAEAIVRRIMDYCKRNPRVSSQKVVRRLEAVFRDIIEPNIASLSKKIDFNDPEGKKILKAVAKISANGDEELADAVMECFELVGDHGNVTINELSGPSSYVVERIEGYPIPIGYEESCSRFYEKFINDSGLQRTLMENCYFLVYYGAITEIQTLLPILNQIGSEWERFNNNEIDTDRHNLVVVATGFSENVLQHLAHNFPISTSINVFPLVAPKTPQMNGQLYFLQDVAAVTDSNLFDMMSKPLETATLADLGPGISSFEAYRYKSTILGLASESRIFDLIDTVEKMLSNPESELDRILTLERMGKISGGIAKLKVIGASSGELREKRDRAEDAVCAVKGAIKSGCLPGGGWTLLKLCFLMKDEGDSIIEEVLAPALGEPVARLLTNCGLKEHEIADVIKPILIGIQNNQPIVYNAAEHAHVNAFEYGILDSTPAVLEAIRNSLSIAALLGTLGGAVVYKRDLELERREASDTQEFLRNSNTNEANERY